MAATRIGPRACELLRGVAWAKGEGAVGPRDEARPTADRARREMSGPSGLRERVGSRRLVGEGSWLGAWLGLAGPRGERAYAGWRRGQARFRAERRDGPAG